MGATSVLIQNLLIILAAGLVSAIISKRLNISLVVGYLIAGALIGNGGLKLFVHDEPKEAPVESVMVSDEETESGAINAEATDNGMSDDDILSALANLGVLFLLFSTGIQFTPSDIIKNTKFLLFGGPVQMVIVIAVATLLTYKLSGDWRIGLLVGFAVSFNLTVLVFKSLEEFGQITSPYGKRVVSILLFQDLVTPPILMSIPLLFPAESASGGIADAFLWLVVKGLLFIAVIVVVRLIFTKQVIGVFSQLKSIEIMVLFTVLLLLSVCVMAEALQIPQAVGAFAAGVALSENRLTSQIAALVTPFRETFSAIFFVTLGALFDPSVLTASPYMTLGLLLGVLLLKTIAFAVAFLVTGLPLVPSLAMGLGLSQLGEQTFIILQQEPLRTANPELYQQILFTALASTILTPFFLKLAANVAKKHPMAEEIPLSVTSDLLPRDDSKRHAIVVGMGPIGKQVTSFLADSGVELSLIDTNPGNIHDLAQKGFRTIVGDASETRTLKLAGVDNAHMVVVTLPNDIFTTDTIRAIRQVKQNCSIVARCRYRTFVPELERAGADMIICEEAEAGGRLIEKMKDLI